MHGADKKLTQGQKMVHTILLFLFNGLETLACDYSGLINSEISIL
jgi:hypothetical protein